VNNIQVAQTILRQLGGNRFIAMTGARAIVATGDGLKFSIPMRTKNRSNLVIVKLTPMDDYIVRFERCVQPWTTSTLISEHEMVYTDNLRDVFESETGLATSL
jgi:hypothetical protein